MRRVPLLHIHPEGRISLPRLFTFGLGFLTIWLFRPAKSVTSADGRSSRIEGRAPQTTTRTESEKEKELKSPGQPPVTADRIRSVLSSGKLPEELHREMYARNPAILLETCIEGPSLAASILSANCEILAPADLELLAAKLEPFQGQEKYQILINQVQANLILKSTLGMTPDQATAAIKPLEKELKDTMLFIHAMTSPEDAARLADATSDGEMAQYLNNCLDGIASSANPAVVLHKLIAESHPDLGMQQGCASGWAFNSPVKAAAYIRKLPQPVAQILAESVLKNLPANGPAIEQFTRAYEAAGK